MSKFLRTLSTAIACLLFVSCQKEYSEATLGTGGGGTAGTSGIFKAKIDGAQYTADAFVTASVMLGSTTILANSKDKRFFAIEITDTVSGTYTLNKVSVDGIILVDSTDLNKEGFSTNEGNDTTQAGGTITISIDKVKKIVSGTFSCKLFRDSDSKQRRITEGSFQVPYTNTIPAAKTTDTFRVKIDGADWTAKSISTAVSGGYVTVVASEQNLTKIVSIQFPQSVVAGTYDFDFSGNYVGLYLPDGGTPYTADSGRITVLERNTVLKRIRANFNFKATSLSNGTAGAAFTNGYFSVGY